MSRSRPALGKVQLKIMQALWARGRATAREITDDLSHEAPIAHSTVQTLLRQLAEKGAVTHDVEERTFVFRPLYQPDEVATTATRDLLGRVFHGSVFGLVSHLLRHEKVSPEEMARLRALLDEETGE